MCQFCRNEMDSQWPRFSPVIMWNGLGLRSKRRRKRNTFRQVCASLFETPQGKEGEGGKREARLSVAACPNHRSQSLKSPSPSFLLLPNLSSINQSSSLSTHYFATRRPFSPCFILSPTFSHIEHLPLVPPTTFDEHLITTTDEHDDQVEIEDEDEAGN